LTLYNFIQSLQILCPREITELQKEQTLLIFCIFIYHCFSI